MAFQPLGTNVPSKWTLYKFVCEGIWGYLYKIQRKYDPYTPPLNQIHLMKVVHYVKLDQCLKFPHFMSGIQLNRRVGGVCVAPCKRRAGPTTCKQRANVNGAGLYIQVSTGVYMTAVCNVHAKRWWLWCVFVGGGWVVRRWWMSNPTGFLVDCGRVRVRLV